MASPQLENGYIKIATEILDALAKTRIPGEARQLLDFILRKTYGWNKKQDWIALSQIIQGTNLKKVHIIRARKKLISMNLISVTQKDNDLYPYYCFNKFYKTWKPLPKKVIITKKGNGRYLKRKSALPKKVPTKDTITIDTITKDKDIFKLPEEINSKAWKEFEQHRKEIKKPLTLLGKRKAVKKLIGNNMEDQQKIVDNTIDSKWTGLYPLKNTPSASSSGLKVLKDFHD